MSYASTDAVIIGVGSYYPEKIVTNADLEKIVDTNDAWIVSRTGIRERRIAAPDEASSDMGARASERALAMAGINPEDLTHIIMPTVTPDTYSPAGACTLAAKIGAPSVPAWDINAGCSGLIFGIEVACGIIAMNPDAVILLVTAEKLSSRMNWKDRSTCILFGDGAGAFVMAKNKRLPGKPVALIEDIILGGDGTMADLLGVRGGASSRPYAYGEPVGDDFFIQMRGQEVYKQAVRRMESATRDILARNNLDIKDIGTFIFHQANLRIMEAVAKKLDLDPDKMIVNVDRFGNTSAASTVIAMDEAMQAGLIKPGSRVVQVVFGAGFTWGASLLKFY